MSEPTQPDPALPPPNLPAAASPEGPPPSGPRYGDRRPGGPPQPGPQGEPRSRDRFPRGDRPRPDGTKPPQLDIRDFAASKPNTRALDQSIEAELNAALAGFDVTGTVAKPEGQRPSPAPSGAGGKKRGRVVSIHGNDVFVDVPGGRGQGVLSLLQFEGKTPQIGQEVEFDIERYDAANGLLVLTMHGAVQAVTDWSSVALGMIVEARVTGINKNKTGLMIEVNGIRGFLPASQLDMYRVENLEQFENQRVKCQIVELDRDERNLIVSRRALLEREREELREKFWATVEEGQVKTGIVRSVKPFGAFVDLGGADGLLPVSELSWNRVADPSEVVQVGQKVEVKVARLDFDARKIGLSLRALVRSPWEDFAAEHKAGARIPGKVTRLADFGAFVEVAPGIEGLIHVSELSTERVRRVRDVLAEGQMIEVQILNVDIESRRMALSLKAMKIEVEAAEAAAAEEERQGDIKSAEERMATRRMNPNLRGGIGSGKIQLDGGE